MNLFAGAIAAALAAIVAWLVLHSTVAGLPPGRAALVLTAIGGTAIVVGFLIGATVVRRARRKPSRLPVFTMLACAAGGAAVGGIALELLTVAYLAQYGTWPPDLFGEILYVLAYPAFGLAGAAAGAIIAVPFGYVAGALLRLGRPALR